MATAERRKKPRIPLKQLAQASHEDTETGSRNEIMGTTHDVSEGGVRFEAGQAMEVGSELTTSFAMGEQIVEANGQVIHFAPKYDGTASMGIKFTGLSESHWKLIENYCRNKASQAENRPPA